MTTIVNWEGEHRSKNLLFCQQRLRNMTVQLVKLRKAQLRFRIKIEFLAVEERRPFIIFQTRDKHVEESGRLWEMFGLKNGKVLVVWLDLGMREKEKGEKLCFYLELLVGWGVGEEALILPMIRQKTRKSSFKRTTMCWMLNNEVQGFGNPGDII